jgi:hypothetical protein
LAKIDPCLIALSSEFINAYHAIAVLANENADPITLAKVTSIDSRADHKGKGTEEKHPQQPAERDGGDWTRGKPQMIRQAGWR